MFGAILAPCCVFPSPKSISNVGENKELRWISLEVVKAVTLYLKGTAHTTLWEWELKNRICSINHLKTDYLNKSELLEVVRDPGHCRELKCKSWTCRCFLKMLRRSIQVNSRATSGGGIHFPAGCWYPQCIYSSALDEGCYIFTG